MSYNSWSEKQIRKQVRKTSTCDNEDRETLYDVLNGECEAFKYDLTKDEKKKMDDLILKGYGYYMEEIEKFSKSKVKHRERYLNEIRMSDAELLSVTHDYFKQFDSKWFHIFLSVFKHRKDNLIIGGDSNITIYLPSIDYSYIKVQRNNSIEDYFSLVHEYTHAIVDRIKYRNDYSNNYPFVELPSLLNELLLCDYLPSIYTGVDTDVLTYFRSLFTYIVGYAHRICNCYYKNVYYKDYIIKYLSYVIPMLEAIELY